MNKKTSSTKTSIPPQELTLTHIFDASIDLVFDIWTNPKHVAQWWGPKDFKNPVCEMDARPGGAILIHMQDPNNAVYRMRGVFHEVIKPKKLVFSASGHEDEHNNPQLETLNTITFTEINGKTKLTLHVEVITSSPQVQSALENMEEGWTQSLERLAIYVNTYAGK